MGLLQLLSNCLLIKKGVSLQWKHTHCVIIQDGNHCLSVFVSIGSVWPERRPSASLTAAFTSGWASAKRRAERTGHARGQKITTKPQTPSVTYMSALGQTEKETESETDIQTGAFRAAYMVLQVIFLINNMHISWQASLRWLELTIYPAYYYITCTWNIKQEKCFSCHS